MPEDLETMLLIRRAFREMRALSISALQPGKSGAGVWVVSAVGADALEWPHPFLVKVNATGKLREERDKYDQWIKRMAHWRHHPRIHGARYAEGETRAILVQYFVEPATPLRQALQNLSPGPVISSLFDTALDRCHRCGEAGIGSLEQAFTDLKALRWDSQALAAAASTAAQVTEGRALELAVMRASLEALPVRRYRTGLVHGDLHADNCFVCGGSADAVVIDFGSAMRAPVVADAACLEVSLSFPPRDLGNPPTESDVIVNGPDAGWIREAYQYPLHPGIVPVQQGSRRNLAAAVAAIRAAASKLEQDSVVYAIAVASYLLRYASFADHATVGDRAFAYELASHLIRESMRS